MRKFFKLVIGLLTFVILASILAVIVVTQLVDPNNYRNQIERFVYLKTGRNLDIQGDMRWSFFPRLGLSLPKVTIGNPKGIEGPPLARMEKLNLEARLGALLTGKIDIDDVHIDNAKINLIQEKNGNNWQQWQALNQPRLTFYAALGHTAGPIPSTKNTKLPIRAISIRNLTLRNSRIQLINRQTGHTTQLRNVDLTVSHFKNNRDFPVQAAYELMLKESNSALQQRINATAHIKLHEQQFSLPKFTVTSFLVRPELGKLPIDIEGKLIGDLKRQTVILPTLTIQIANLNLTGQAALQKIQNHSLFQAEFNSTGTAIKPLLTALTGSSRLSGTLDMQTSLKGELGAPQGFARRLNGQGRLSVRDGVLDGINLANLMRQALALTGRGGNLTVGENGPNETPFNSMRGTYQIRQGVLQNNDLVLEFTPYLGKGAGTLDLSTNRVDYALTLLSNNVDGKNIELPTLITGSLSHLNVRPDFGKIAGQYFKKELNNFLTNPPRSLKESLKQLLP